MFSLSVENSRNETLKLTQDESNYQVIKVDGLNPPKATINTSKIAGVDGTRFNSVHLGERNLVLTIKINGDVEQNRVRLYQFFNTKNNCKIYYKNTSHDVFIEGYVETNEVDMFSDSEIMQVSIICPSPYFKQVGVIVDDISKILNNFCFPFAIDVDKPIEFSIIDNSRITNVRNDSESDTGVVVTIEMLGHVDKIRIVNIETGEQFTLIHNLIANDIVTINMNKGSKSIALNRKGINSNIFTSMVKGSNFFTLRAGNNFYSYLADDGVHDELVHISFEHFNTYRGV